MENSHHDNKTGQFSNNTCFSLQKEKLAPFTNTSHCQKGQDGPVILTEWKEMESFYGQISEGNIF